VKKLLRSCRQTGKRNFPRKSIIGRPVAAEKYRDGVHGTPYIVFMGRMCLMKHENWY